MINVTKPFLPDQEDFLNYVKNIWDRNWLTNNGPLLNEFELNLKEYFNLKHFILTSNGTIPLQIAIKALGLKGEIITTPFSYVATTSSIVWENCSPVFVDIDEHTFNINPELIEASITKKTKAILATHVYGNPCEIDAIREIADKHGLKVIYDAAHCFGTSYKGKSVFTYGDVSTTSFHATKLFHTVEGGGLFTNDADLLKRMAMMRNFGHAGPTSFDCVGINGKNSEFHAAMGLANLKKVDEILSVRKHQYLRYLEKLKGLDVQFLTLNSEAEVNYAYFPIVFKSEADLLNSVKHLNNQYVYPRRYFYPSLNTLDYVGKQQPCPVSESVSTRVLCLPLFHDLSNASIDMICRILLRVQNN